MSNADTLPLEALCEAYESHHFDSTSNVLHAAGMAVTLITAAYALCAPSVGVVRRMLLLWLPPLWYLWAWAGHFFIQKDIPAVFTYGMTLHGWASGECCSLLAFFGLRTTPRSHEMLACVALTMATFSVLPSAHPLGERPTMQGSMKPVVNASVL